MTSWDAETLERRRRERALARHRRHRRRRLLAIGAALALALVVAGGVQIALSATGSAPVKITQVVVPGDVPTRIPVQAVITMPATGATRGASLSGTKPPPTKPVTATTQPTRTHANQGQGSLLRPGSSSSFVAFEHGQAGPIGVAVEAVHADATTVLGDDSPAHGWSTTKVPVLVALLKAENGALTAQQQQYAQLAITESDNQSILELFGDLENIRGGLTGASSYVTQLFRDSGDTETVVATAPPPPGAVTTFGQTEWSPSEAVKFYRALAGGCLLPSSPTSYVLGLMQHIVPSESWGLGSAGFTTVAFKGGWGPENGAYLVRQSGVINPGTSDAVAVSIVAHPPPGGSSFTIGTEMVTQTALWLEQHINLIPRSGQGCSVSG